MPFLRALQWPLIILAAMFCVTPALADKERLADLIEAWLAAPHGNYQSPSFTYWNKTGAVPQTCAACHSEPGFIDYLGADGSARFVVDKPAAINSPIGCASCHNAAAHALDTVPFPSGVRVNGLGTSAVCTVCHQGRQSGDAVAKAVAGRDEDTVSSELSFINIHYGVAAGVMHGSEVRGGFQYPDRNYAGRFAHVPSASSCVSCHDPHSTRVETKKCMSCHRGVEEIRGIRTRHVDFDGDGQTHEGIHAEIMGLHAKLYQAIQRYGTQVSEAPIGYAPGVHPYFFHDKDADGQISGEEAVAANRYARWTPRLLKAAHNYQLIAKDTGAYAHNPTYVLQLLYDSLESLSERIDVTMRARRP